MYPAIPLRRDSVHPAIVRLEQRDRQRFSEWLNKHPPDISTALYRRWQRTYGEVSPLAAYNELRDFAQAATYIVPTSLGDEGVRSWAERRARSIRLALARRDDLQSRYERASALVRGMDLEPPEPDQHRTLDGCVRRMSCPKWWRRQARRIHLRESERKARELGLVSNHRSPYVSPDTYRRWLEQQGKNARVLADTLAVNDDGEAFVLADLVQRSVANPQIRRSETMTRVSGFEDYADKHGHQALFLTVTAPPEFHAVRSRNESLLPGAKRVPNAAHAWLQRRWTQLRAKMKRCGTAFYGMRVVEPHHDGTPHWHVLAFMPKAKAKEVAWLFDRYFIGNGASEARQKRGLTIVWIDRSRGRASGYIAKYIAKNIDGSNTEKRRSVDQRGESMNVATDPEDAALRVRAWASTWGVRQFQFFGGPPVTLWRELRRLGPVTDNDSLELLRKAADDADWERFVTHMGGPCATRGQAPAYVTYVRNGRLGEYGEPVRVAQIAGGYRTYETRPRTWDLIYVPGAAELIEGARADASVPWSSVNNCTPPHRWERDVE